jgi:hypothetical protein
MLEEIRVAVVCVVVNWMEAKQNNITFAGFGNSDASSSGSSRTAVVTIIGSIVTSL